MQVKIEIYDNEDNCLRIDNYPSDENMVSIHLDERHIVISIEELRHALRKISCK